MRPWNRQVGTISVVGDTPMLTDPVLAQAKSSKLNARALKRRRDRAAKRAKRGR
jgi:hypothetical protein